MSNPKGLNWAICENRLYATSPEITIGLPLLAKRGWGFVETVREFLEFVNTCSLGETRTVSTRAELYIGDLRDPKTRSSSPHTLTFTLRDQTAVTLEISGYRITVGRAELKRCLRKSLVALKSD